MAEVVTYRCDMCGRQKGEANHWFKAINNDDRFLIGRWSDFNSDSVVLHLCGMECAQKAMAKAMQEGK